MSCFIKNLIRCEAHKSCQTIEQLNEAIYKLEESCGVIAPRKNTWQPSQDMTPDLENMLRRIRLATEKSELRRLEQVAIEDEVNSMKEQLETLREKDRALTEELQTQQRQKVHYNSAQDGALTEAKREAQACAEGRMNLIYELIRFRDHLDIFTENAVNDDQKLMEHLLHNLSRETAAILGRNGVEVLNGTGPFSTDYQEVAAVVQTDDPALEDIVESTFSDGYRIDNRLYRPQKVNLYTFPAAAETP